MRKEFCECSLTAGSFQLDETLVKCTPEIHAEADGNFKSYFTINKIIFDYLQAERNVQLDSTVVQALGKLIDVKPEYDWMPLNWYVNPDLPDNVINQQPSSVIADLMGVMEHIITEGEEEAYQSEIRNAQSEFKHFIRSAETSVKAFTLPPAYLDGFNFKPPTLPPNWGDKGAEGQQKIAAKMSAWITVILIIIAILAIAYTILKKCRYVSSLPRVCFPLYPFNTIL